MIIPLYYFQKADNHDGVFVTRTGEDDIYQTATIWSWEGKSVLNNTWRELEEGKYCNLINGTDSSYFRPFRTPESENLFVFKADVCR